MPKFDLKTHIDAVFADAREAYEHQLIWLMIREKKNAEKHREAIQEYCHFFDIVRHGAHYTVIIKLGAIFDDKGKNVMSLSATFKMAFAMKMLSEETVEFYRQGLIDHGATIKGVKLVRHKLMAHVDNQRDADDVYEEAGVTANAILALIRFIAQAVNNFDSDAFRCSCELSAMGHYELEQLLDHVDKTICEPERQEVAEAEKRLADWKSQRGRTPTPAAQD